MLLLMRTANLVVMASIYYMLSPGGSLSGPQPKEISFKALRNDLLPTGLITNIQVGHIVTAGQSSLVLRD